MLIRERVMEDLESDSCIFLNSLKFLF